MSTRSFIPALLAVALAAAPVHAAPTPKGAPTGYETKFKQVIEAEKNEEYEKALALLDEIPAEKHNVYTRLKRAGLLVRLGRFIEAEEILSALMKDPKADAIRATVQGDLDDLRARLPKLTIRLSATGNHDVWVTLDDKPVGPPVTVPLNPGTHVVIATRAGKEVFKQKVTLQDSQTLELEIDTSIAPPAPPVANVSVPGGSSKSGKDDSSEASGFRRAAPALAIGLAFAAGSVTSFVLMSSAQRSTEENCATQHSFGCNTDDAGGARIRTWETLGWVTAGAAVAAVGVGIVLWTTADSGKEKRASATAKPMLGTNTIGLSFSGSF